MCKTPRNPKPAQCLAEGGVISQEQYEVCKNNARARDWRNLKGNLSSFQEQPSIEKVLDIYRYGSPRLFLTTFKVQPSIENGTDFHFGRYFPFLSILTYPCAECVLLSIVSSRWHPS